MKSRTSSNWKQRERYLKALRLALGGTMAVAGAGLLSTPVFADDAGRIEKLEQENQALQRRLSALESMAQKEGILPSGDATTDGKKSVSALSDITLSGFVTASYFYDTSVPGDRTSNGYLWNTSHNAFSLNKVKLTLASTPAERSGEAWDAAFRVSMIWGEDAPIVNTGGEAQGFEALREAYVELNAPIGTGLNLRAGQLISLLNYESGDGGAANANFSQGYQWYYTGNGPSAGVQAGYVFTDWLDVKLRLQNGMYTGAFDNNSGKTVMGALGIKPNSQTWLSLVGFGGKENANTTVYGASLLGGGSFGKFTTGIELDWFRFDGHGTLPSLAPASDADLYSAGVWLGYDFTPKVGLALRAEFLSDPDGGGIPGVPLRGGPADSPTGSITSPDSDGKINSVALTLNWKPVPNIKIQPEIRFDNTTYKDGFDGQENRFLIGMGASYLF